MRLDETKDIITEKTVLLRAGVKYKQLSAQYQMKSTVGLPA